MSSLEMAVNYGNSSKFKGKVWELAKVAS
jgi:hypothetical protein